MKRKEISEYLDELLDVAGDIDMSINIVGDDVAKRNAPTGTLALALVASTLMFCIDLLEPGVDAAFPDHADALTAIVSDALHGYYEV